MITKLAIKNYRSIFDLVIPLSDLNLVIGANGSGKSNLYKALRLLSNIATGGVIKSIAREGGLVYLDDIPSSEKLPYILLTWDSNKRFISNHLLV